MSCRQYVCFNLVHCVMFCWQINDDDIATAYSPQVATAGRNANVLFPIAADSRNRRIFPNMSQSYYRWATGWKEHGRKVRRLSGLRSWMVNRTRRDDCTSVNTQQPVDWVLHSSTRKTIFGRIQISYKDVKQNKSQVHAKDIPYGRKM